MHYLRENHFTISEVVVVAAGGDDGKDAYRLKISRGEGTRHHQNLSKSTVENQQKTFDKKLRRYTAKSNDSDDERGAEGDSGSDDNLSDVDGGSEMAREMLGADSNDDNLLPDANAAQKVSPPNMDRDDDDKSYDGDFLNEESESDNDSVLREDEIQDRLEMTGDEEVKLLLLLNNLTELQLQQYYNYDAEDGNDDHDDDDDDMQADDDKQRVAVVGNDVVFGNKSDDEIDLMEVNDNNKEAERRT